MKPPKSALPKVGDRFEWYQPVFTPGPFGRQDRTKRTERRRTGRIVTIEAIEPDGRFRIFDGTRRTRVKLETLMKDYLPVPKEEKL